MPYVFGSDPTYVAPPNYFPGFAARFPQNPATAGATAAQPAGPVSNYDPAVGGVPSAPSPQGSQLATIMGNLSQLTNLLNLSKGMGGASAAGANQQLIANLPGYQDLATKASSNIQSNLAGTLPPDVMAMLNQKAAERGVAMGSPESANANAAALRAMGLTSLDLQNLGQTQLTQAIGRTPTGPQYNPASMQIDPATQLMYQWLANQLAAAPIPSAAAGANLNNLMGGVRAGAGAGASGYTGAGTAAGAGTTNNQWLQDLVNKYLGMGAVGATKPPYIDPNAEAGISTQWNDPADWGVGEEYDYSGVVPQSDYWSTIDPYLSGDYVAPEFGEDEYFG